MKYINFKRIKFFFALFFLFVFETEILAQCSQDTIKPVVILKRSIHKELDSRGKCNLTVLDIDSGSTDNCTSFTQLSKSLSFGSQFNVDTLNFDCLHIGLKTISYRVIDSSGNVSNVNFSIRISDAEKPVITAKTFINKKLNSSGLITLSISDVENGSVDNCTSNSNLVKSFTFGNQSNVNTVTFNCAHIGAKSVTYKVEDASSNVSKSTIIVNIFDTIPPTISSINSITKYLNDSGVVTLLLNEVELASSDNCTRNSMLSKSLSFGCRSSA